MSSPVAPRVRHYTGVPLPDDLRARLLAVANQHGEGAIRRALHLAPATIARLLGGLRVQRGTVELIRNRIGEIETPPPETT